MAKKEIEINNDVLDEADMASNLEMEMLQASLDATRAKVQPEKHPDFDGKNCVECGDKMPKERLKLGRVRCVYCQDELEKLNKLYNR